MHVRTIKSISLIIITGVKTVFEIFCAMSILGDLMIIIGGILFYYCYLIVALFEFF